MIKNIKIYIVLYFALIVFGSLQAATIDLLQDNNPAINTNQSMVSGNVNKRNLKAVQEAFKQSDPKDSIKSCTYSEDEICKIVIRERMPTLIRLPKYEWTEDWILGDDINFEVEGLNNSVNAVAVKSYYSGVDTSLNIIGGSGLIYSFYILSNAVSAEGVSDFIVNIHASDETLEQISQARRFYKDKPIPKEFLTDIKAINLKNHSLHSAFSKMLPKNWNLDIDKKLSSRARLIDVISEGRTREEVINDLAHKLNLNAIFYPKLRLLVITDAIDVIE